ncbi:hypothetical protein [uncultured Clostridium sp.]|nr:hypothetical protein [uncultured Clostridium sp.]
MKIVLIIYILVLIVTLALCKAASKADENIKKMQRNENIDSEDNTIDGRI